MRSSAPSSLRRGAKRGTQGLQPGQSHCLVPAHATWHTARVARSAHDSSGLFRWNGFWRLVAQELCHHAGPGCPGLARAQRSAPSDPNLKMRHSARPLVPLCPPTEVGAICPKPGCRGLTLPADPKRERSGLTTSAAGAKPALAESSGQSCPITGLVVPLLPVLAAGRDPGASPQVRPPRKTELRGLLP